MLERQIFHYESDNGTNPPGGNILGQNESENIQMPRTTEQEVVTPVELWKPEELVVVRSMRNEIYLRRMLLLSRYPDVEFTVADLTHIDYQLNTRPLNDIMADYFNGQNLSEISAPSDRSKRKQYDKDIRDLRESIRKQFDAIEKLGIGKTTNTEKGKALRLNNEVAPIIYATAGHLANGFEALQVTNPQLIMESVLGVGNAQKENVDSTTLYLNFYKILTERLTNKPPEAYVSFRTLPESLQVKYQTLYKHLQWFTTNKLISRAEKAGYIINPISSIKDIQPTYYFGKAKLTTLYILLHNLTQEKTNIAQAADLAELIYGRKPTHTELTYIGNALSTLKKTNHLIQQDPDKIRLNPIQNLFYNHLRYIVNNSISPSNKFLRDGKKLADTFLDNSERLTKFTHRAKESGRFQKMTFSDQAKKIIAFLGNREEPVSFQDIQDIFENRYRHTEIAANLLEPLVRIGILKRIRERGLRWALATDQQTALINLQEKSQEIFQTAKTKEIPVEESEVSLPQTPMDVEQTTQEPISQQKRNVEQVEETKEFTIINEETYHDLLESFEEDDEKELNLLIQEESTQEPNYQELIREYKQGTIDFSTVLEANRGLIRKILRTFPTNQDLQQVAEIALWRATEAYDSSTASYSTFVTKTIFNALLNETNVSGTIRLAHNVRPQLNQAVRFIMQHNISLSDPELKDILIETGTVRPKFINQVLHLLKGGTPGTISMEQSISEEDEGSTLGFEHVLEDTTNIEAHAQTRLIIEQTISPEVLSLFSEEQMDELVRQFSNSEEFILSPAFQSLTDLQKSDLLKRIVLNMEFPEIAKERGVKKQAVQQNIVISLEKLRKALTDETVE